MQFDDGEVLTRLNDTWSFLGANAIEWGVGLVMFIGIGAFAKSPATAVPFMLASWVGTTITLSRIRKSFPDEERGARNAVLTACGFPPPGIPAPSSIQPVWSASPLRELDEKKAFSILELEALFPSHVEALLDADSSR